jgi:hypothetical protein
MPMFEEYVVFWIIQIFILILGLSIGHSILIIRKRKEENRRRELELSLLEKRTQELQESKKTARYLEEVLFKAKVQQEINDILKKKSSL